MRQDDNPLSVDFSDVKVVHSRRTRRRHGLYVTGCLKSAIFGHCNNVGNGAKYGHFTIEILIGPTNTKYALYK